MKQLTSLVFFYLYLIPLWGQAKINTDSLRIDSLKNIRLYQDVATGGAFARPYYIPFMATVNGGNHMIIMANTDLISWLMETYHLDSINAIKKIDTLLRNKSLLNMGAVAQEQSNYIFIPENSHIYQYATLGIDKFIKTYFHIDPCFEAFYLNPHTSGIDKAAIIYQLFKWKIASWADVESGILRLDFDPYKFAR